MKKILPILFLMCVSLCNAQIVFEKGYFINNNGVRINCRIENVDWFNSPKSFTYKLLENDQPKNENYMSVREFGIDNVCLYKRFTLNVERSSTEIGSLPKTNIAQWNNETLFLKALVTGDANLYVLNDPNVTKYFFESKNSPIGQLVHLKYLSSTEGTGEFEYNIRENNQYRQQLMNALKCSTTESDFSRLEYNKNALTNLFMKHNNCIDNSSTTTKSVNFSEKNKYKVFALKVTPGVYLASLSITDPNNYYNVSQNFSGIAFKMGLETEFILPFNKNTWSVYVNPAYEVFNAQKKFLKSDGRPVSPKLINYNADIKYSAIEVPIGFRRYFFLNSTSKIFLNAAYVVTVSLSGKAKFSSIQEPTASKTRDMSGRSNISVGAGYSYKKFSAEIRFNTPREVMSGYISWSGKYTTTGVVLGYALF